MLSSNSAFPVHPQYIGRYTFTTEFERMVREDIFKSSGAKLPAAHCSPGYFTGNTTHLDAVQKLWDEHNER